MPKSAGQAIIKPNETASAPVDIEPLPLPADLSEILPADDVWVEAIASGKNPPGNALCLTF